MAKDSRKRQKKLERRKAKAKAKKKALARQGPRGTAARLEEAAAAPILHCYTTDALWDEGISSVLISRKLKSGHVAFAVFLLDVYCLGVKDVMLGVVPRSRYDWQVHGKLSEEYRLVKLKPEAARKLVEGAVGYARGFGLQPHPDYRKASVYGKDGKPYFVAGPYDSPWRCKQIIRTLTDHCGPDGFYYTIPVAASGAMLTEGEEFLIEDDIEWEE